MESLRNCDYRHVSTQPGLGHPLKVPLPDFTTQVHTHEPLKGTPCLKYISVCLLSLCKWITLSLDILTDVETMDDLLSGAASV